MWGLGVLPAALPAPLSATLSPAHWVYLCKCGAAGSASARTACAICPTLRQSQSSHSHRSPLHPSARLRPSYQSGWMIIFCFLGVSPPFCSILCQFWLCEEAQCVYLRRHLGSDPLIVKLFMKCNIYTQNPHSSGWIFTKWNYLCNHRAVCVWEASLFLLHDRFLTDDYYSGFFPYSSGISAFKM